MKLDRDVTDLESAPCPLGCPPEYRKVVSGRDRIAGAPGEFSIVECRTCGLMRTEPRPTPEAMGAYYPDDYAPYGAIQSPPTAMISQSRLRRALGFGTQQVPAVPPGRMLELGCASGNYMERMRAAGWQVDGIEFSSSAASVARQRGFHVVEGAVENAPEPSSRYDVIVAWMVLEHLHQPLEVLKRLRTWIEPDGYLVFSVPDTGAIERRVFGGAYYALHLPNHLYHYSRRTITKVLRASGWEPVRFFWQPNPNNLIRSMEYKFEDWGMDGPAAAMRKLATSARYARLRTVIGWGLARLRQSGRMEVWARPAT